MTSWPKELQWAQVSTTTSPVTHTDVVAVNKAVRNPVVSPGAAENGSQSSMVPAKIARRKLMGISRTGEILLVFNGTRVLRWRNDAVGTTDPDHPVRF